MNQQNDLAQSLADQLVADAGDGDLADHYLRTGLAMKQIEAERIAHQEANPRAWQVLAYLACGG